MVGCYPFTRSVSTVSQHSHQYHVIFLANEVVLGKTNPSSKEAGETLKNSEILVTSQGCGKSVVKGSSVFQSKSFPE